MADGAVGRKGRRHVARVVCALVIGLMTIDTCRAGQVVVVIDVAGSAGHRHVRAGQRKSGQGMVKGCVGPRRCRMARLAIG